MNTKQTVKAVFHVVCDACYLWNAGVTFHTKSSCISQ